MQENKWQEGKRQKEFVNQFGRTHLHLGATKPRRKSTSVVLIQKLSTNSSFALYDLRPTCLDFNLGTPRTEFTCTM